MERPLLVYMYIFHPLDKISMGAVRAPLCIYSHRLGLGVSYLAVNIAYVKKKVIFINFFKYIFLCRDICLKIYKKGSTGDISAFPFIANFTA